MKVLWFSNIEINDNISSTGTWIYTMANSLIQCGEVELVNITEGNVAQVENRDNGKLQQWIIPRSKLSEGLPNNLIIKQIEKIVNHINPDIVHIWGTENYWGLLFVRGILKYKYIVDVQGLKYVISQYFLLGLSFSDLLHCVRFRDLVRPKDSIFGRMFNFYRWGIYEKEILMGSQYVGVQSNWVRAQLRVLNPMAHVFNSEIVLREEFRSDRLWNKNGAEHYRIFTSASTMESYKGIHILIEALSLLRQRYPKVKLIIAGYISPSGVKQNSYDKLIIEKIKQRDLIENVHWLGSLTSDLIASELLRSNLFVVPSFIESYCVALDEALSLGVPSVASYTGAIPELINNDVTGLLYSPLDIVDCAAKIEMFFNLSFAEIISNNVVNTRQKISRHTTDYQIKVYKKISDFV